MGNVHFGFESDLEECFSEKADCGTLVGESSEFSHQWSGVTCKRCINNRDKIESALKIQEENILEHMGAMVAFQKQETNEANL